MPRYTRDHIHLRSRNPEAAVQFYHDMFGAKIVESTQTDGRPRIDGLTICIAQALPDQDLPHAPDRRYIGLDHFGLQVEDLDEAAADLRRRGAEFISEPRLLRPGLKIAFVRAPDDVRIEILERKDNAT